HHRHHGARPARRGAGGHPVTTSPPLIPRRGRDRKAEVLLPAAGRARFARTDAPHVAVAGGGIAGLAAATLLAERGARVTLYEAQDSLEIGRASGRASL